MLINIRLFLLNSLTSALTSWGCKTYEKVQYGQDRFHCGQGGGFQMPI